MLLNKKQAILLLNNAAKALKEERNINFSLIPYVAKNEEYVVSFQGETLGVPGSYCGIACKEDKLFIKFWESNRYAKKRIPFINLLFELKYENLNIRYNGDNGEEIETAFINFQNWSALKKSDYCYLESQSFQTRDGVEEKIKELTRIFAYFVVYNKGDSIVEKYLLSIKHKDQFYEGNTFKTNRNNLFIAYDKPQNADCERVVIVGPYPTKGFIENVYTLLQPQKLYVVVDESWKPSEIEEIKNSGFAEIITVRTESGVGIVHAKMYYVEYKKKKDNLPCTRLFFGSINASQNSVKNNSEFFVSFRLSAFDGKNQNKIRAYFKNLINPKVASIEAREVVLKNNKDRMISTLFFPSIRKAENIPSFYNWLRSGSFFIKYDVDPNFGYLTIKLNAEKIPQDELSKALEGTELESKILKQNIRIPYTDVFDKKNDSGEERWKKYSVDTCNGLWISSDCLSENDFPPKSMKKLKQLKKIKSLTDEKIKEVVREKIEIINYLREEKKELQEYICRLTEADEDKMVKKIEIDRILANNGEYEKRYTTGYSKINVSMNDSDNLTNVAKDFIESCMIKKTKKGTCNKMARQFKKYFNGKSMEEILNKLLNNWEKYQTGLVNYYKKSKF